jgi:hypothetical protein
MELAKKLKNIIGALKKSSCYLKLEINELLRWTGKMENCNNNTIIKTPPYRLRPFNSKSLNSMLVFPAKPFNDKKYYNEN